MTQATPRIEPALFGEFPIFSLLNLATDLGVADLPNYLELVGLDDLRVGWEPSPILVREYAETALAALAPLAAEQGKRLELDGPRVLVLDL